MADAETNNYDLGEFRFGKEAIIGKSFKVERKVKVETKYSTNSYDPYDWSASEREISWEVEEVDPQHEELLNERYNNQTKDKHGLTINTYNFMEDGDYEEKATLQSCWIESIEAEQDGGRKISVKGGALKLKS